MRRVCWGFCLASPCPLPVGVLSLSPCVPLHLGWSWRLPGVLQHCTTTCGGGVDIVEMCQVNSWWMPPHYSNRRKFFFIFFIFHTEGSATLGSAAVISNAVYWKCGSPLSSSAHLRCQRQFTGRRTPFAEALFARDSSDTPHSHRSGWEVHHPCDPQNN